MIELQEAAAVVRLGQSAYAAPGQLSWAQREYDTRTWLDALERAVAAAARSELLEELHITEREVRWLRNLRLEARLYGVKHIGPPERPVFYPTGVEW